MKQQSILLVDDDRNLLDRTASILREAGFAVTAVVTGDIALVILEQGLPFRVLITEVAFPGVVDGLVLAERACALIPGIAVIYLTKPARLARLRSRAVPASTILAKPWDADELVKLVHSLASGTVSP